MLRFKYTVQQCIDYIRLKYSGANGFTMNYPCEHPKKCNCYATFGMTGWNHHHQHFKTCRFSDKGKYISAYYCIYYTLARTDLLCMKNWGTQWTMVSYLEK